MEVQNIYDHLFYFQKCLFNFFFFFVCFCFLVLSLFLSTSRGIHLYIYIYCKGLVFFLSESPPSPPREFFFFFLLLFVFGKVSVPSFSMLWYQNTGKNNLYHVLGFLLRLFCIF